MVAETFLDTSKVGKELKSDIVFDGKPYNTSLFLAPILKDSPEYTKIVNKISSRKQFDSKKGKFVSCLGITKSIIKEELELVNTSLYVFVNEKGKSSFDQASGSLQMYNWSKDSTIKSQVWICDLCRNAPNPAKKSQTSPVKPIMHLFEQISYYLFNKSEIYLMVEKTKESVLKPLYEKYGFAVDASFVIDDDDDAFIVMKKQITPDPTYIDFPFAKATTAKATTAKTTTANATTPKATTSATTPKAAKATTSAKGTSKKGTSKKGTLVLLKEGL